MKSPKALVNSYIYIPAIFDLGGGGGVEGGGK